MSLDNPTYLVSRACPTCGASSSVQETSSRPPGEDESFSALEKSWFGFFKTKIFFSYNRCSNCELLYSPVYFSDEALQELYRQMPDNTAGVSEGNLRRTQNRYLKELGPEFEVEGDYLELGPDIGLLTAGVLPMMPKGGLWLFEPNVSVHRALQKVVDGTKHVISREMTDFNAVPDGTIGLCAMIHVMDHLPHPGEIVRQLAGKLNAKGRLLIVTHDESSLLARILKRRWPAYCLQHPQLFNKKTTESFLRSCGLKTFRSSRAVNYFPIIYLLKHLLFAIGMRSASNWRVWGPTIPLRLGNRVTVAVLDN
jgi:hypothetical protein